MSLINGAPLQVEDLDVTLRLVTFKDPTYVSSLGGKRSPRKIRRLTALKTKQYWKRFLKMTEEK